MFGDPDLAVAPDDPVDARSLLAAHRAYRHAERADPTSQLFQYPNVTTRPGNTIFREAVIRTCQWLNLDPPWMHRTPCRDVADMGLSPRVHGWLTERGLSLHAIDPVVAHQLTFLHASWLTRPAGRPQ